MYLAVIAFYIVMIPVASVAYLYKTKDNSIYDYANDYLRQIANSNSQFSLSNKEYLLLLEEKIENSSNNYRACEDVKQELNKHNWGIFSVSNLSEQIDRFKKDNLNEVKQLAKRRYFKYMFLYSVFWLPILILLIIGNFLKLVKKSHEILSIGFNSIYVKTWDLKDLLAERTREKKTISVLKEAPSYRALPEKNSVLVDNL